MSKKNDGEFCELNLEVDKLPMNLPEPPEDDYVMAITGKMFGKLVALKNKHLNTAEGEKQKYYSNWYKYVLKNCFIYARMKPDDKSLLVECLKEQKYVVCMCGDGANDCGALKNAEVGVSLSHEVASISAPFSSQVPDISSVLNVLLEGKAALVTSIQTFKFMMIYSLIQFISVTILSITNSYLSDYQFLASDLFIIFPLAFLISRTETETVLTPDIPTGSLVSFPIISSIVLQAIIMFLFQFAAVVLVRKQKWYKMMCGFYEEEELVSCYENTAVFLVSNVQYLISAISFSITYPFKKSIFSNYLLIIGLLLGFGYSAYLILKPDRFISNLLLISEFRTFGFRTELLVVCTGNYVASYLTESYLVPLLYRKYNAFMYEKKENESVDNFED